MIRFEGEANTAREEKELQQEEHVLISNVSKWRGRRGRRAHHKKRWRSHMLEVTMHQDSPCHEATSLRCTTTYGLRAN
jgi:hypothetical protein